MQKVYEIPVLGPIVDFLNDLGSIAAIAWFVVAGFLSYSDVVAPASRDEAVLGSIAMAIASFVGFRLDQLALYLLQKYHKEIGASVALAIDAAEKWLESAVKQDVIPDWLSKYAKHRAITEIDDFATKHPPSPETVKYIEDLKAELGKFI